MKDTNTLITGGSRGIGLATAKRFLENGGKVSFCARREEEVAKAVKELREISQYVHGMVADVRDPEAVTAWLDGATAEHGPPHVLVNNAGVAWSGDFSEQPLESLEEITEVNVFGVLNVTRAVLPQMLEHGEGVIVNIASAAGQQGIGGLSAYSASKFAVRGFTEALQDELMGSEIFVHAVCPGAVATDMQVTVSGERRGIEPEQVAELIHELATGTAATGQGECVRP